MDGLRLTDLISDLSAWICPRHPSSYSVFNPNGTFSAKPKLIWGLKAQVKKPLGITVRSPPSPPSPVPGAANAPVDAWFENLNDGLTTCSAPAICLPGINVIAAGLYQATLASSAAAAPPAKAFPVPLPLCVPI